jgi:crossover junction endodeoxyribonuclease RuvC
VDPRVSDPVSTADPPAVHAAGRVLGIDPGLETTGYGALDPWAVGKKAGGPRLVEAGVIRGGASSISLEKRLAAIHRSLQEAIAALKPAVLALEQLYSHYAHPRTSILMGHARGVICLAAAEADIPVVSYSATQIKRILTGNGRAPKSQVQLAIQRELRLDHVPEPPDVADALAVAICHCHLGRLRGQLDQSTTHRPQRLPPL